MPHLSSLTDYKKTMINCFLRDPELVELITGEQGHALPASDLLDRQVFLYDYIDSTVQDDRVILCIETDDGAAYSCAIARFELHIFIAVPKSKMSMDGKIRRDAIAERIDTMLNGSTQYGFGKLTRRAGGRVLFNNTYRTRVLHYTVEDWNRHNETL